MDFNDYDKFVNGLDPETTDTDEDGLSDVIEVSKRDDGVEGYDPIIQESTPPEISKVEVTYYETREGFLGCNEHAWLRTKAWVEDNVGVDEVKMKYKNTVRTAELDSDGVYKKTFDLGSSFLYNGGEWASYDVYVTATDVAGNSEEMKGHCEGWAETIVAALTSIWSTIVAVAQAIADALASLVNWIWDMIEMVVMGVLNPIITTIQSWANNVDKVINDYVEGKVTVYNVLDTLTGGIYSKAKPILSVVNYAFNIGSKIIEVIGSSLKDLANFISEVIHKLIGEDQHEENKEDINNKVDGLVNSWPTYDILVLGLLFLFQLINNNKEITEVILNDIGTKLSWLSLLITIIALDAPTAGIPELVSLALSTFSLFLCYAGDGYWVELIAFVFAILAGVGSLIGWILSPDFTVDVVTSILSVSAIIICGLDFYNGNYN